MYCKQLLVVLDTGKFKTQRLLSLVGRFSHPSNWCHPNHLQLILIFHPSSTIISNLFPGYPKTEYPPGIQHKYPTFGKGKCIFKSALVSDMSVPGQFLWKWMVGRWFISSWKGQMVPFNFFSWDIFSFSGVYTRDEQLPSHLHQVSGEKYSISLP